MLITITSVLYWENLFFSFQQMSLKGSSRSNIEGLGPPFTLPYCYAKNYHLTFNWGSAFPVSVCLIQDKVRLKDTSQIGKTMTRLLISGPVALEFSGKIWGKYGTDVTTQYHLEKVSSSIEWRDFSQNWLINNTNQDFSWVVLYIF